MDFKGFNIHPGSAKNTMINAALVAMEFNNMLPAGETPRDTDGYEGFYHLTRMSGNVEKANLNYILRDHDADNIARRQEIMKEIAKKLNEKYGAGTVNLTLKEEYRNMAEKIRENFHLIENAKKAVKKSGVEPQVVPVRGGTDGARLSFMGLPCPNLGTGSYACHGPYEHATAEGMDIVVDTLTEAGTSLRRDEIRMGKEVKTNAMRILDRNKVPYEILNYECDEFIDGLHTAQATGAPVEQSFKTLVAKGKSGGYYVFVIPIAEKWT